MAAAKAKRGRPKKSIPSEVQKVAHKKSSRKIVEMANKNGGDPTLVYNLILEREEIKEEKKLLGKRERDINAKIKANGYNISAVNDVIRDRQMSPDVLKNRFEDRRMIIQSCPDMDNLDLFGVKDIQKFVNVQKEEAQVAAIKEHLQVQDTGAVSVPYTVSPVDSAKALMGTEIQNREAAASSLVPAPMRVSEVITH